MYVPLIVVLICITGCVCQDTQDQAVVYKSNKRVDPEYFTCSNTPAEISYSQYLSISNVLGFTNDCIFWTKSTYLMQWAPKKPYTGILKASIPITSALLFSQDFKEMCQIGIEEVVQVFISRSSDYDIKISPQSVSLSDSDHCVGYFQFFSPLGTFKVVRKGITVEDAPGLQDNPILFDRESYMESKFEYYELKNCGSKMKPMLLDHGDEVESPSAVLDSEYPSGTQCFYQVDPHSDHCHTVLHFDESPFNSEADCNDWHMEASFTNSDNVPVTEKYDCSLILFGSHVNPPWIIHHSEPVVMFQFGDPVDISDEDYSKMFREDRFTLKVDCLHTGEGNLEGNLVCSAECAKQTNATQIYEKPCWGRSSRDCVECRYSMDESQCVSQCPADKFRGENGMCQLCDFACLGDQSCLNDQKLGCYKLCGAKDGDAFRIMSTLQGETVTGYFIDERYVVTSCEKQCRPNQAAIFNLTGTQYEFDELYNTDPASALQQNLVERMDIRCTDRCPPGFSFGKCGVGQYKDVVWCCPDSGDKDTALFAVLIVLIPLLVGAFLVLVVVLIVYGYKRHKKTVQRKDQALRDFYVGEGKSNIKGVANRGQLIIVEPDAIELKQVIGQGAFGCVYSAIWRPPNENVEIPVAVKQLKSDPRMVHQSMELLEEAKLMASVNHDNLIRLIAISMNEPMMLITKFMTHGGSLQFIVKHKDIMTSYQFMEWSRQLAAGMAHLESLGMIHRDLAGRNVLVEDPKRIRISDFGLSKVLDADKDEVDYQADDSKLPIRWLAKECLVGRLFSHKSDVWAFGVTLWEFYVYGTDKPYGKVDLQTVKDLVIRGRRLVQPQTCSLELYTIMLKCWMTVPDSRPSFTYLENWFAESRECASKYFFTKMRNEPLGDAKKIQSNLVNLSTNSSNSNEFANKTTAEADMRPKERTSTGRKNAQHEWADQHQADTSIPRREGSGSDEEYLVPQKPPTRPPPPSSGSMSPPPSSHFRAVDEDEYLRPVAMPKSRGNRQLSSPYQQTSSIENDSAAAIPEFSAETKENELQKFFPGMNVQNFERAHNLMENDTSYEPSSNYKGRQQSLDMTEDEADNKNMDRKEKTRISQRWKDKKPPLQQQQAVGPSGDYMGVNGDRQQPSNTRNIATADSMRRNLPAESSV